MKDTWLAPWLHAWMQVFYSKHTGHRSPEWRSPGGVEVDCSAGVKQCPLAQRFRVDLWTRSSDARLPGPPCLVLNSTICLSPRSRRSLESFVDSNGIWLSTLKVKELQKQASVLVQGEMLLAVSHLKSTLPR